MVIKLTGTVDGEQVMFERKSRDTWICTVPATLSGTYVIDLTAIDEAGNVAYYAKFIVAIDITALRVSLEPYPWRSELLSDSFFTTLMNEGCGGLQ